MEIELRTGLPVQKSLEKEGEGDGAGTDSGTAVRSGDATDDD